MKAAQAIKSVRRRVVTRREQGAAVRELRRSTAAVGLILAYHGLASATDLPGSSSSPALGIAAFRAQLDALDPDFEVVGLSDLLRRAAGRNRDERIPLALTFDDDLESHATAAATELVARGLTATFFLGGSSLDGPSPMWWQVLDAARAADAAQLERELEREGIGASSGWPAVADAVRDLAPARRDAFVERLLEAGAAVEEPGLRREQVAALAAGGFEIGFHTRRHDLLTSLDDGALRRALRDGREELGAASGSELRTIAYPHGAADRRVAAAAAEAGFELGVTTQHGWARPDDDPLLLRRVELRGERRKVVQHQLEAASALALQDADRRDGEAADGR